MLVSKNSRPLWELLAELLPARDPESEWYSVADIAPLLGIKRRSVLKHARDLWPGHEGHYRLNKEQAVRLLRRVCYSGRKLPAREVVEAAIDARDKGGIQ
jgi:hypothetical protein